MFVPHVSLHSSKPPGSRLTEGPEHRRPGAPQGHLPTAFVFLWCNENMILIPQIILYNLQLPLAMSCMLLFVAPDCTMTWRGREGAVCRSGVQPPPHCLTLGSEAGQVTLWLATTPLPPQAPRDAVPEGPEVPQDTGTQKMGNKQLSRTGLRVEGAEKGKGLAWPEEGSGTDGRGSKRGHQLRGGGRDT